MLVVDENGRSRPRQTGSSGSSSSSTSSQSSTTSSSTSSVSVNSAAYRELKSKTENVINYLNYCSDNLKRVTDNLDNYYIVNGGNSELDKQVKSLKTDINKTSNFLKQTILPEIRKKI